MDWFILCFLLYFLIGFIIAISVRVHDIRKDELCNDTQAYVALFLGWGFCIPGLVIYFLVKMTMLGIESVSDNIAKLNEKKERNHDGEL